jgi:4-amino-4-deoxy-L-arabinose transferase-like glycosyltransferase
MSRSRLWLAVVCLVSLVLLLATAVPGAFTVDDCNYLASVGALRHGTIFVPGTEGLPPSIALYAYEPTAFAVRNPTTPVPLHVPPLYALMAYPFSFMGWYGLVLVNVLATLATVLLVYTAARRLANQERAGWYAAALWLLGASTIEYAQGLWPHMLAVALVTAGFVLVALAITSTRLWQAVAAGFLLALAAGVRYQNAVLLFSGFLVLLIWGTRRWRSGLAYLAGTLLPVGTAALFNHARMHSWNPFSKGLLYSDIPRGAGAGTGGATATATVASALLPIRDFFLSIWTRVVDHSALPPLDSRVSAYMRKLATGDVVTAWGVLKKSWLQASPWVLLGLVVIMLAWLRRDFLSAVVRGHLRRIALPMVLLLAVFGFFGVNRHDGMSFNQRYLLELAPLVAIAVAVTLAQQPLRWTWLASGFALGVAAGALVLVFKGPFGYRLQSLVPLILAVLAACLGIVSLSRPRWFGPTGLAVALCLAWSFTIHVATDLQASRRPREDNQKRLEFVEPAVSSTPSVAILAALGHHDGFCPLLLSHDIVIVTANDAPIEQLPPVLDALLAKRRVFMWLGGMPEATLTRLQANYRMAYVRPPLLAEILK